MKWRAWVAGRLGGGSAWDLLYPRCCLGCGSEAGTEFRYFCWDCASRFRPLTGPMCRHCGETVEGRVDADFICAACRDRSPAFARARSAVRFDGVLREAVHAFKYREATWLAGDLFSWLWACTQTHYDGTRYGLVVPVPLHRDRLRQRGYNQSALLARALSRRLGVPAAPRVLQRIRPTPSQTRLTAGQRISNVQGAFAAVLPPRYRARRVLLVDDVMTTGATVGECARCLVAAGAEAVDVVTVARG
jgi:ComF family protein